MKDQAGVRGAAGTVMMWGWMGSWPRCAGWWVSCLHDLPAGAAPPGVLSMDVGRACTELIADEAGSLAALLGSPGTRRAITSPHAIPALQS